MSRISSNSSSDGDVLSHHVNKKNDPPEEGQGAPGVVEPPSQQQHQKQSSSFVASMTFASAGRDLLPNCDCDECGTGGSFVPETIRAAIREHKRQKLLASSSPSSSQGAINNSSSSGLRRTQNRALVRRCSATAVAVWEWTLPLSAEPLLEFGNASVDRLLWVKRLPQRVSTSTTTSSIATSIAIQSIGTGIVGSSHEEKARLTLDWKEGDVLLVPSNQGKAVGWVVKEIEMEIRNTTGSTETATTAYGGPAVFIIVKVPHAILLDHSKQQNTTATCNDDDSVSLWSRGIVEIYSKAVIQRQRQRQDSTNDKKSVTRLRNDIADQFKQIVKPMLTN